jgi:ketosteroid isomerase-like protein
MKKLIVAIITIMIIFPTGAQPINAGPDANSADPVQVVKDFLTAYREKDHEKFASLLHPDVVWIQPGDNNVSGVKTSKEELFQMGGKMKALSAQTLTLTDVKYFSANGNTVVCILHWKAVQPTGILLDVDNIDVYTVENGKIIMAKIFSEDILKENKFWGK